MATLLKLRLGVSDDPTALPPNLNDCLSAMLQHAQLLMGDVIAGLTGIALAAQDKFTVQVTGGISLGECKGYDDWAAVSVSHPQGPEEKLNLIVANPTMIEAYRSGIPADGKPFPDGSKIVKILWKPRAKEISPFAVQEPDTLLGVGCMVRDSPRFADSGGWGYGQFNYDPASDTFAPDTALQGNDAKCGASCHQAAEATNYVFTHYGKR